MNGMPSTEDARFELLKLELASIQSGIRGLDSILFQIKGWCVTVCVAIAGATIARGSAELLIASGGAVCGFWLVDANYKSIQRVFIDRDLQIERAVASRDPLSVLNSGALTVPGLASAFRTDDNMGTKGKMTLGLTRIHKEALLPITFGFYLMLLILLSLLATGIAIA